MFRYWVIYTAGFFTRYRRFSLLPAKKPNPLSVTKEFTGEKPATSGCFPAQGQSEDTVHMLPPYYFFKKPSILNAF
jgi:hypothetical protein